MPSRAATSKRRGRASESAAAETTNEAHSSAQTVDGPVVP